MAASHSLKWQKNAGKGSQVDKLEESGCEAAKDHSAPDPQSWPKVKCLKLASPGLSSTFTWESLPCWFRWARSAFRLTMLTTLQSLLLRRLCHHPDLPAAQRTSPLSLPALHLTFWLGHKISLELLGLPVLKYFWGPSSHSWMACFLDLLQKLETRPEEEVGGIAPEMFASIPGLWEGTRVPIVYVFVM